MADDDATRKVKAVRRRAPTPVADQPTRPVKAVKRRPPRPAPLGLLPEAALEATCFRFLETNLGFGLQSNDTTNRYEVQLESATLDERDRVLLIAAALFMDRVFHTGERD